MAGDMHGGGSVHSRGHVWQGTYMVGGMHSWASGCVKMPF